jgi:hypothetical protein
MPPGGRAQVCPGISSYNLQIFTMYSKIFTLTDLLFPLINICKFKNNEHSVRPAFPRRQSSQHLVLEHFKRPRSGRWWKRAVKRGEILLGEAQVERGAVLPNMRQCPRSWYDVETVLPQ